MSLNVNGVEFKEKFEFEVKKEDEKKRLDVYLSEQEKFSRNYALKLISDKKVFVNDKQVKPSYKIKNNDQIRGWIPKIQPLSAEPENIPLNIVYEDEYLAVINKSAGMVVHPAPGHESGTLVNALLYHFKNIKNAGEGIRPGIVHRLDKDTSGAIIVAKTPLSHEKISDLFKKRDIEKKYLAIVIGAPPEKGVIDKPIGRHPRNRKKMSVVFSGGRDALSYFKVLKQKDGLSLLEVEIKTGRTHQIRVHMTSEGYPLIGDEVYGFKSPFKHLKNNKIISLVKKNAKRQMLHSYFVSFIHPFTGKKIEIHANPPNDMADIISNL